MPAAARISDMHVCPKVEPGPVPHVGGPTSSGEGTVIIGGMPAARVGDSLVCFGGPPDSISQGEATVIIGGQPAARLGDGTSHGGVLVAGCPTVIIGSSAQAQTLQVAASDGKPFCEECEKRRRAREAAEREAAAREEAAKSAARESAMERMAAARISPAQAQKTLKAAVKAGLEGPVLEVINSGKLGNLRGLSKFLETLHKEAIDVASLRTGRAEQFKEVHRRILQGHDVVLEGVKQVPHDWRSGQADIVDHTSREAIQMKSVTGGPAKTAIDRLNEAVEQLGGAKGEFPPESYQRVADIRLQPSNALYTLERPQLAEALRGKVTNLGNLLPRDTPPGVVRIVNAHGLHTFTPGDLV